MITGKTSKPVNVNTSLKMAKQREEELKRQEFVEHLKREVESSTYKIKSEEIAEKVSQKIREDLATPQILFNRLK